MPRTLIDPQDGGAFCHCGRPLHYSTPAVRERVEHLIWLHGPFVDVTVEGRTWRVQRHYLALHGLKARELPELGFEEKSAP